MNRIIIPIITSVAMTLLSVNIQAKSCSANATDTDKLACYDMFLICSKQGSSPARLRCYDDIFSEASMHPTPDKVGITPDEGVSGVSEELVVSGDQAEVKPLSKKEVKDFGKRPPINKGGEFIESRIVEVTRNARREDYFRLENGQVWREVEDEKVRIKVGQTVKIEKGVMGSFNLRIEGIRKLIKVRRVS